MSTKDESIKDRLREWARVTGQAAVDAGQSTDLADTLSAGADMLEWWSKRANWLEEQLAAAREEIARLTDWRATVTAALLRPGGAFYEDVPKHIREMREELAAERARREQAEHKRDESNGRVENLEHRMRELYSLVYQE